MKKGKKLTEKRLNLVIGIFLGLITPKKRLLHKLHKDHPKNKGKKKLHKSYKSYGDGL